MMPTHLPERRFRATPGQRRRLPRRPCSPPPGAGVRRTESLGRRNRHDVQSGDRFGRCQQPPKRRRPTASRAVPKANRPPPAAPPSSPSNWYSLHGDPQQNAGQRAATSRPPPGAAPAVAPAAMIAPSARERIEVLRNRRNDAYASAGKTVSRHSGAATAAAPEAMIAPPRRGSPTHGIPRSPESP